MSPLRSRAGSTIIGAFETMRREILYGRQPALEALRARRREVYTVYIAETLRPSPELDEIRRLTRERGLHITPTDMRRLDRMTEDAHHQGVALEVLDYPYTDVDDLLEQIEKEKEPLLLALDHVQDPQNVGSILRSAEAAGVTAVLIPKDRAAQITPAVVRASAGASEHARICMVTNLVRSMVALQELGVRFFGLEGLPQATLYTRADYTGPAGLVVGSEGDGLGRLVRETCDGLVRIPIRGRVGSLNAASATAVALYEIVRQRGQEA